MTTSRAGRGRPRLTRPTVTLVALALVTGLIAASPAGARQVNAPADAATYHGRAGMAAADLLDIRAGGSPVTRSDAVARAQRALSRQLGPKGLVDVDACTGTPRMIARLDGFLTAPSDAAPADVALRYVGSHLDAFGLAPEDLEGLRLVKDYEDVLGTHHLIWQ